MGCIVAREGFGCMAQVACVVGVYVVGGDVLLGRVSGVWLGMHVLLGKLPNVSGIKSDVVAISVGMSLETELRALGVYRYV